MIKKTIAFLVALSFVFSNIVFADTPKNINLDAKKQAEITTDPEKIVVPRDYGLVKSRYIAKDSKKLVIHIQDAHCNYEAQSNIIKILECLIKNDGLGLISVEGADGFIDTSWFKAFPDADIRKEVADYFMKKGEITGPEFLSITSDYPVKLFGAETRSYYIENLNAFTSSYPLKEDTEKYFNQIKAVLNKLKNYIYSDELKELDTKSQDYESKKLSFTDYVKYLESLGQKHNVNLRQYENLFKLVSVLIYEKKINFNVVDKERATLIDVITKKLEKDALTELVNKSLEFKVGKISSAEYYNYLKALAVKHGISMSSEYPNLFNYIIYNSVYSRIENEQLFNDIKKFEEAVKNKIFTNDDQRTLDNLSRRIDILLGLVNIRLLNDDFDYYKSHRDEFTHEIFAGFIKKMTERYGFAFAVDAPSPAVTESMPKLEDFYSIAIKRDKALVDNTIQAMRKEGMQISVLVTGGFHSEGITKLLEKQGVSYMVICPNITKDVETPYIKILTNQRTPLEEILSDTSPKAADVKNVKNGMLAPYLITGARLDIEKLRSVKEIGGRAEAVLMEWATMQIAPWLPIAQADLAKMSIQPTAGVIAARFNTDVDKAVEAYIEVSKLEAGDLRALKKSAEDVKRMAKDIIAELLAKKTEYDIGAIRGNGGAYTVAEHGTRGALAENIRTENSIVGVIADLILKGDAHSLLPYKMAEKTKNTDKALGQWDSGRLDRISRDNLNQLMSSEWVKDHNIVIVKGLKRLLALYRIVEDFILEPGIARNSYYIDENDFLYFLSLKNGVELIQEWDTHEMTHIKNPKLSEDVVEVLAPSYDVRLAVLTRSMSKREKANIDKAYASLYRDIMDEGKEYTSEEAAKEYDISAGVAAALLDKISAESDTGKIKKEMYKLVMKNTPQAIKDMSMVKVMENGDRVIEFTEENLGDFNEKDNPAGMSILSWFKRYAKEANVSTAGIRGIENILFSQDPRELIGQKAIFFATVAKALVAMDLYPGRELHKLAGSEVRYNSREFVEFIARIQASFGIKTHIAPDMETVPIWMASFLIFKYDLLGGEFVTSSHAISKKNATKDLTSEGSQYTPDESKLFIEKIKGMIQTIQKEGVFRLVLSRKSADLMIDEGFMKKINNGMNDYVKYLKEGVATPENLTLIKLGSRKIYIDVVGGSMYRTMSRIFEMLGIADRFNWLHKKEDPFFHGIGKACYRLNTAKGTLALEDLSCDTSIIVVNPKDEVGKIVPLFIGDIKMAIAQKPVGTQILTPVPNSNSKIMGQIRSVEEKAEIEKFYSGNVVYIELDAEKVFVIETDKKILPVIRTMGYKKSLSKEKAPVGTVIELTDPDGDRLITAQIVSTGELAALEKLGVAYEILDQDRAIAVFMPNQSFLMTIDFRREMLKRDGKWADKNWFMLKTTASAAAWDDWSAAQIDKSYRIKYAGTGEWKEARGIPVVNTPVGFKELATVMRKVEKQMRENPEKEVIIEDIFGNQINLGVKPHLLFAGEESGGEIFGSVDMIKSANGREAIAMREKSAGEAMVITSAMASEHESLIKYLEDVYGSIRKAGVNLRQYDYREDVIYFNESEPDPGVRAEAEKEGIKKKEINEAFYLAIAIAIKEEKTTFEKARTFLQSTFPTVDFEKNPANPSLQAIEFVGDGIYLRFADRIIEVRPSGTEAKTKGYALGPDLDILISDAKMLGGYYSEEMASNLLISPENPGGLLDKTTHDRYFKWLDDKQMLQIKAISLDIYNEYLAKGTETKPFVPPSDYGYLSIPEGGSAATFDHTIESILKSSGAGERARKLAENMAGQEEKPSSPEIKNATVLGQKLHAPLAAAIAEMAARFMQGGYNQPGYGVPQGASIDGSFSIGNEGNQGYYVNGGREIFLSTVKSMQDFFERRAEILGKDVKYVIKPGIGGQHTPFQGIADVFQLIDIESNKIVGEYELGKDYEASLSAVLKELKIGWDQIAVVPSSKSGSTDETMMIFTEIFYVLLKNIAATEGMNGKLFADIVLNTMHEVNFTEGKERPGKDLFKGFNLNLVRKNLQTAGVDVSYDQVKKVFGVVLGNMFFETTDRAEQSRLSAFIRNSGLDKELGDNAPGFGAMFDNVGGRWTADLHMMLFLAYNKLNAEEYWQTRYLGIQQVREGTHQGTQLADKILRESITDIALIVPDELFWFGKAMEQNFNESIWQKDFANLIAIKESMWESQKANYAGKPSRLVINISSVAVPGDLFNVLQLKEFKLKDIETKQEVANRLGELFTTFYGMTYTVGNVLIVRALAQKGYAVQDVELNNLDNPATRIVQQNLYVRQPYVELGKGLLEKKLKGLQEKGAAAIEAELSRIVEAAKDRRIESNISGLNLPERITCMEELANVINKAVRLARDENRKFVPLIYLEGEKFQELREHLTKLGIEWVMQGTGDQHISYQQVLAQPQKYLPFIISFIPEQILAGRPAVGFAKDYLNNISSNMVRDSFAEASYHALVDSRKNEAGEEVKGAAGIFLRMTDSKNSRSMLSESFDKAIVTSEDAVLARGSHTTSERIKKTTKTVLTDPARVVTERHLIFVKSAIPEEQRTTTTAINYANFCADYYNGMEGYTADMVDDYEDAVELLAKNPDWDKTNTIVGLIDKQALDKMTAELERNDMKDKTKLLPMEAFDKSQFIPLKGFFDLMAVLVGVNRPLDRPEDQELKSSIRNLLNEIGVRDVDQLIGTLSTAAYFEDPIKFAKNFILRLLPSVKASNPAELREKYSAAKRVAESL